jgi:hypothetical protein
MKTASFGDPDWTVTVTPIGLGRHTYTVHRYAGWRVRATFAAPAANGILDARKFADSAGTVAILARIHLALQRLDRLPTVTIVLDSQQVHDLTGEPLSREHEPELPGQLDALQMMEGQQ